MAELGEPLSVRELDVLGCIVNGAANKDVAAELHISQNTVKVHLRNIYTKLGASSRTEAVTTALQQGLVVIPGVEEPAVTPPTITPESSNDNPPETAPSSPTTEPESRKWPLYSGVILLVLLGAALAAYLGAQAFNQTANRPLSPTPTLFPEEAIGQSQWFTTRPLTTPLSDMAVASVGLDIFHIGGETETGVTPLVNRFDTLSRTWHEMAAKPTAVSQATAAVLFGEIYVPGGRTADGKPTNIVEAYSPANNAWRPVANLPKAISQGLTLSDGHFLYILGGWDGENYLDDVFVYDVGSDSWRPLTKLPASLAAAAGGAISGQLLVLGGTDGKTILDSCYAYTIAENSWDNCSAMLRPRAHAAAAIILNKLYILGGDEAEGSELPFGEFYDADKDTWQVVNMPMLAEAKSWRQLGATNVETKIYALGGKIGGALSDGSYIYSPLIYQTFIPAAASAGEDE